MEGTRNFKLLWIKILIVQDLRLFQKHIKQADQ